MLYEQDVGLLLFYYLGIHKIRNQACRLKHQFLTRFVMFHDTPPEFLLYFEKNLRFIKENTNVVSMDDFFAIRLSNKKLNVVITFDDGYKSWLTVAIPLLKHLSLPATFFISSGFLGLSRQDESRYLRVNLRASKSVTGGLQPDDVNRIAADGFAVGGHSIAHRMLSEISDEQQLRQEIIEDKYRLEKIIEKKIDYFAYPFGDRNNPVHNLAAVLKEAGYRGAVTTQGGLNTINTERYSLHRELTNASMPLALFKSRVYGNSDLICRFKKFL